MGVLGSSAKQMMENQNEKVNSAGNVGIHGVCSSSYGCSGGGGRCGTSYNCGGR